ncbi:baseplate protein [Acinetobacter phage vB_AbaP_Alexa]|nr:baseplate protein [Acinetobacter phage vB_AbaP_Alexa]
MPQEYRTKDGDTVDFIAWKQYGSTDNRVVEKVLAANLGLADIGPILPAGLVITLPDVEPEQKTAKVKLWD